MRIHLNLPGPFSVSARTRRATRLRDVHAAWPEIRERRKRTQRNLSARRLAKQYRKEKILY